MQSSQSPRIFVGVSQINRYVPLIAKGFRQIGYRTESDLLFGAGTNRFTLRDGPEVHNLQNKRRLEAEKLRLRRFVHHLFRSDIFIFAWAARSFFDNRADLDILKAFGKKIVMIFAGCDLRHYSFVEKDWREGRIRSNLCGPCPVRGDCRLEDRAGIARAAEKYGDVLFARPAIGHLLDGKYELTPHIIDLDDIQFGIPASRPITVLHAPSAPEIKGTDHIVRTVEKLRKEGYPVKLTLLERNAPQSRVLEALRGAHIVIDQLLHSGYGIFACEAMASGCAVLSSYQKEYNHYPDDVPIVDVTADTLYGVLHGLLENPPEIKRLARLGRAYAERECSTQNVARYMENIFRKHGLME